MSCPPSVVWFNDDERWMDDDDDCRDATYLQLRTAALHPPMVESEAATIISSIIATTWNNPIFTEIFNNEQAGSSNHGNGGDFTRDIGSNLCSHE